MGKVNVYLPNDLERAVRAAGLSVSAVCQTALQRELDVIERLRAGGDAPGGAPYTPQLASILDAAMAERAARGADLTARDLVGAIVRHGENLGARALAAAGVELPEPGLQEGAAGDGSGRVAADARDLLVEAYKVAVEMRHPRLGPEHVVIASAAQGSPLFDVFSVLGISDRLLQQQVERLISSPQAGREVGSVDGDDRLDRLDREVRRLAAEIGRLREDVHGGG